MLGHTTRTTVAVMVFGFLTSRPVGAGTVTGATAAPNPVTTGAPITVTVTGTNPCGAVHIIWGDSAAITYPITTLPTHQTHVYDAPGTYTIVVKGMGNCDGETTTTIRVDPPPTPPPAQSALTGVSVSAQSTRPNVPVTITLEGRGACTVALEFGDGNSQTWQGELPHRVRHNYPAAGEYTIAAAAQGPCTGAHRTRLTVAAAPPPGVLTRLVVSSGSPAPREAVSFIVEGSGACAVEIDFADGNTQTLSGDFPQRVSHTYTVSRTYDVVAIAQPPCTGSPTARVRVGGGVAAVTDVFVSPNPTRRNQPVTITIEGQGSCGVAVRFGDGNETEVSGALPIRVLHNYPLDGAYEIVATAMAPCSGIRGTVLDVRRE